MKLTIEFELGALRVAESLVQAALTARQMLPELSAFAEKMLDQHEKRKAKSERDLLALRARLTNPHLRVVEEPPPVRPAGPYAPEDPSEPTEPKDPT